MGSSTDSRAVVACPAGLLMKISLLELRLGSKHLPTRGSVVTVTQLEVGGTYLFGASEADFEPYLPTYLWTAPRRIIAARARSWAARHDEKRSHRRSPFSAPQAKKI